MGKDTKSTILKQKYSQRDAFFTQVYEMMKDDSDIVIVVADQGAPIFDKVRRDFPHRFFNVGIAEQQAILLASGLANEGKKVFVYAISTFMIMRCYEQIRVSNSVMKIPITIVGVGTGFSYDDSGPTHHMLEDISIMRVLPHMTIHSVSDNVMAQKVAELSVNMETPNYVRLDRHIRPDLYDEGIDLSDGFGMLEDGTDGYIISVGMMADEALKYSNEKIGVIDLHTIPCNESKLCEVINNKKIITLEEHFLPGGMGSYILEIISDNNLIATVERIGLTQDYCYRYGGREDNWDYHGINKNRIDNTISKIFKGD
jgi:transketolase